MRNKQLSRTIGFALGASLASAGIAVAQTGGTVIFDFPTSGVDGDHLYDTLVSDPSGNLYGTTLAGGGTRSGAVFELSPSAGGTWTFSLLHAFSGADGAAPIAGLFRDAAGNLYGTTYGGGANSLGTVFELAPQTGGGWAETVLHSFLGGTADGAEPRGSVIMDTAGNLYGTTLGGGQYGKGTAFELTPSSQGIWTETLIHSFGNGADGSLPYSGMIFDSTGSLYGTTHSNNNAACCGIVYQLVPGSGGQWTEKILFSFNGKDGAILNSSPTLDTAGNLYGTAAYGTSTRGGEVFELSPASQGPWTFTALHVFQGGNDGFTPESGVTLDAAGNLYGTTLTGGTGTGGTVFKLTQGSGGVWTITALMNLGTGNNAYSPWGTPIFGYGGNLYGTTYSEATGNLGTVFSVAP